MKPVLNVVSTITLISVFTIHSSSKTVGFDFASPTNVGPTVNSSRFYGGPSISPDGLNLYFTSDRGGGSGGGDLWVTKRAKPTDAFGVPENLGPSLNSPANEFAPSISADGLSIYFDSDRPGGLGSFDIWVAARATTAIPFAPPRNLGAAVNRRCRRAPEHLSRWSNALFLLPPRWRVWGYGSLGRQKKINRAKLSQQLRI